jgi:hypothetical protein
MEKYFILLYTMYIMLSYLWGIKESEVHKLSGPMDNSVGYIYKAVLHHKMKPCSLSVLSG